jgi:hypothetical protein
MKDLTTTANRMSRSRREAIMSVGAIGLFVFTSALTAQPARCGESSVSPAEDEMRNVRDQLQRHKTGEPPETTAPKEMRIPEQRSNDSSAHRKRMDENPERAPDKP